jgi:hypothetical protein
MKVCKALFDDACKMFGIAGDECISAGIDDEIQVLQDKHADQDAVAIGFDDGAKRALPACNFQRKLFHDRAS